MKKEGTYNNATSPKTEKGGVRCNNAVAVVRTALEDGTLESWARAGANDRQLAYYLGIGKDSYIKAKKEIPELADRIQRARRPLVPEAFHSLVMLAKGYDYTESTEETKEVLNCGEIVRLHTWTTYHKHMAPNLNAISRVIVNYQKLERDKQEGIPTEFLKEAEEINVNRTGRLAELDEAMKELFFSNSDSGSNGNEA